MKYGKIRHYIGAQEPDNATQQRLEKEFLEDIQNNPDKYAPKEKQNIIAVLQGIMAKENYISEENFVRLSRELEIPLVNLQGVATFYSQFRLTKPGKHTVKICDGTACHVKNSPALQRYLEETLDIKAGQVTKDGNFGLEVVNCIGACARAPSMMIDETVYGKLDKKKIKEILVAYK
jgi:NADH:ubiquinone oxidoreductase subunit E